MPNPPAWEEEPMSRLLATASRVSIAVCFAASLAGSARADRLGKGHSMVEVGIGGHTGQFTYPGLVGLGRYESGEVGGQVSYFRFLSDAWALGFSGGYHGSRMKEEDSGGSFANPTTISTHSYTIRIGGDRYAFINDDVALYAGPGLFWTRGRVKTEVEGFGSSEGPDANERGFNGRIGMYARLGKGTALYGHIGQVLSYASGEDASGRSSWWSSTHEGSVGLAFDF
jgi:hypothetical protein